MKALYLMLLMLISVSLLACSSNEKQVTEPNQPNESNIQNVDSMKLKISFGTNVFTATLYSNATATAFKGKLPVTMKMNELNGNEKYSNLPNNLPTSASNPGTIQAGDLVLYRSNTLVLFYKTFSTSYSYTRVGRIDNPEGLAAALGSGSVRVTFGAE
jgi:hypothetical protein